VDPEVPQLDGGLHKRVWVSTVLLQQALPELLEMGDLNIELILLKTRTRISQK
jgi:hypothetical protein